MTGYAVIKLTVLRVELLCMNLRLARGDTNDCRSLVLEILYDTNAHTSWSLIPKVQDLARDWICGTSIPSHLPWRRLNVAVKLNG